MNRQEIIKKLQADKQYPFGWLEKEEQELIKELHPKGHVQYHVFHSKIWDKKPTMSFLDEDSHYRIDPAYSEPQEPEYVYYDIYKDGDGALRMKGSRAEWLITNAETLVDFVEFQDFDGANWLPVDLKYVRLRFQDKQQIRAKFRKG